MGLVGDISPKNMTDRPILEHRADLGQSSNTRTRMDPLSEVFGSMSIQEAVYKRLEATAPWGVRYSGDIGPRIRFILVVRGSALLRFKSRTVSLSAGDLFISILSYEPFYIDGSSPFRRRRFQRRIKIGSVWRDSLRRRRPAH